MNRHAAEVRHRLPGKNYLAVESATPGVRGDLEERAALLRPGAALTGREKTYFPRRADGCRVKDNHQKIAGKGERQLPQSKGFNDNA